MLFIINLLKILSPILLIILVFFFRNLKMDILKESKAQCKRFSEINEANLNIFREYQIRNRSEMSSMANRIYDIEDNLKKRNKIILAYDKGGDDEDQRKSDEGSEELPIEETKIS